MKGYELKARPAKLWCGCFGEYSSRECLKNMANIWLYLRRQYTIPVLVLALAALLLRLCCPQMILNERLQLLIFPAVLLIVWRIPRQKEWRLPISLVMVALACWLLSALHIRGYLYGGLLRPKILLASLAKDDGDLVRQEMARYYRQIAQRFTMPELSLLYRDFADGANTYSWWANKRSDIFVYGQTNWANIAIADELLTGFLPGEIGEKSRAQKQEQAWLQEQLRKYGISAERNYYSLGFSGERYLLALNPESVHVPLEPKELILHVLGFVAKALHLSWGLVRSNEGQERLYTDIQATLTQALSVKGEWKSYAPLALVYFLRGNFYLMQAQRKGAVDAEGLNCALRDFQTAAGKATINSDPFIMAAILNDIAVIKLMQASVAADYQAAVRLLRQAAGIHGEDGLPVRGGRIAFVNLIILDRLGFSSTVTK